MARGGQVEYGGEEVPAVVVAERSSSSPYSRSVIKDIPLDGLLGKGMVMNEGLQDFLLPPDLKNTTAPGFSQLGRFRLLRHRHGAIGFNCAPGIRCGFKE